MPDLNISFAFIVFCIVMTSTPGPNNALVMISAARFGLSKTVPLILGIAIGVGLQLMAIAIGLNRLFEIMPKFQLMLSIFGTLYMIWLAWRIASSGPLQLDQHAKPAMGFIAGALFQWLNPKAWIISISAVSTYLSNKHHMIEIALAALILVLISIPCVGVWSIGGIFLRKLLTSPKYAFIFNIVMSIALLMAVLPTAIQWIVLNIRTF